MYVKTVPSPALVLAGATVALDALSLLEDAADDDPDWEEEDGGRDSGRRVVILDSPSAVGAVVPGITVDLFHGLL